MRQQHVGFVGRAAEQDALAAELDRAGEGQVVVFSDGDAGAGNWTTDSFSLPQGTHYAGAVEFDVAGNTGISAVNQFTVQP